MLRIARSLMALFLGLCLAGCDGTPTPQSASPQPLPASIPYHPTKIRPDTAKQVAFAGKASENSARCAEDSHHAGVPGGKAAQGPTL
jgi:hypothetical protein